MTREIHSVMKNSGDLDYIVLQHSIHDEMPSPSASACDVKGSKTWKDFVAGSAPGHVRAIIERSESLEKRYSVDIGLTLAEYFCCVPEDADEVFFGLDTETDLPVQLCQLPPVSETI